MHTIYNNTEATLPTFYSAMLHDPRFDRVLTQHMRLFIS
ncbi:hypothetical protein P775_22875 [Puniceibacterium antarcticum]|uniref:Uncharacterized protein n=1 Tax=Puniceibacterium antarcticum TaxID=1206336 RepID=A0A2G8R8F3_9RHOB|nr:hypothetical protein P775_22875 [Puniceibacterium antarcticum]